MAARLQEKGIVVREQELRPYIDNMPTVMAAADLVICRAGASTISELTAMGKPAILVPSPYVAANHQYKNAKVLADRGGVALLEEQKCSGSLLYETALELLADGTRRAAMSRALKELAAPDATEDIYNELLKILK
jgi:UDP-N-acetylglucosamine--N-acetylmuramyl-(pentapeptide) pyrophosphoryl-undecaprenol N-acetylglucosamine transferase